MARRKTKIGLVSLGCPKNRVDSEVMLGHLVRDGFEITTEERDAEVLVVNTCGFIDPAKEESIQAILEMAEHKTRGSCRKLIVTGCLVERYRPEIEKLIPEVDAVLGVNELERIVQVCSNGGPTGNLTDHRQDLYLYNDETPRVLTTSKHVAYIKIAEGCDHACSFCIIPALRGVHRSRPIDSIVREAGHLAASGVKELNLVSQDTTRYGYDLGLKHGLARLLEQLVGVEGITWIRVHYTYPNSLDSEFIDVMAREPKICNYLDLPLQHVSVRMLSAMKRGGSGQQLMRMIDGVREKIPDVAVRTTMIVGFPGETEEDFDELRRFCERMRFDHLGVFTYSDEEGTTAYALQSKVPEEIKVRRRRLLMEQQAGISLARNRRYVGRRVSVLLDGVSDESEWILQGRTAWQSPEIDGSVLITDSRVGSLLPGGFYDVQITRAMEYDLVGRAIGLSG